MTKEIYTFQRMARVIDESIVDFPISFYETKAGTLCPETYHDHEFIELVLVTAGTGIHVVDGRRAEIREGEVQAMPDGTFPLVLKPFEILTLKVTQCHET